MSKLFIYRTLQLLLLLLLASACKRVVVTVDTIPGNTPSGQPIYITGNFNNWDPGDESYRMTLNADSTYSIALPPGFGTIEYKFTRGDWTTVEKDICGYEIDNRSVVISEIDTAVDAIESWNDLAPLNCPRLTLLVTRLPAETRPGEPIAIAGNFNSWSIDSSALLSEDSSGNYSITIERPPEIGEIEFKLTRGDLSSAEADEFGNMIPNRVLQFGVRDTVKISIDGWIDRPGKRSNRVVLLIDRLPGGEPRSTSVYMASSMNGWMPGDKNYLFQVDRGGRLYFPVPRKKNAIEYKLTRGNWSTVEVDRFGYDIPNRVIGPASPDTVYLEVAGWRDLSTVSDYEVTLVIDHMPASTPEDDNINIAGNFNGWNPGRSKYSFHEGPGGMPMINLPRDKGFLEFKLTRGSWRNVEVDAFGSDIPNRVFAYRDIDTLYLDVENWKDLPPFDLPDVTLVIDNLPTTTPPGDDLFLAYELNGWDPGDRDLIFDRLADSRPYITVPKKGDHFEYKITRGDWSTVEVDENGDQIPNRTLSFGFADTVHIRVLQWEDL
jgi:hypothetical protein